MPSVSSLLIVSLSPQHLERGALWFKEHTEEIRNARSKNLWWQQTTLFLEEGWELKPALLVRTLVDFGYERAVLARGPGLFAVRGGIIEVWPINVAEPYLIEFTGNAITTLRMQRASKHAKHPKVRPSATTLIIGSFVVHIDHGIGILREIGSADASGTRRYFVVEYAPSRNGGEPDRLYVPTDQEDRLSPYIGFETPKIHRLGGSSWEYTKRKVKEETEKLAKELLALYAKRNLVTRPPYKGDSSWDRQLRGQFNFQDTEDQERANEEILADLSRLIPMDRVLCGDVGFGKTELAVRAALRVIASGAQVAVLAPTTILAAQHETTFKNRFHSFPVSVAMLSCLTPPPEQKRIRAKLAAGSVDCVIGTHRLLSKDIAFNKLGLVIIDEEQRFGVKQKEYLKSLRTEVDVLSLSATPIPRTMQLTLAHLRDISFLRTPPAQRLPIKTFVLPYTKKTMANAIGFELERGGQIYFLHNRIETIEMTRRMISKILERLPAAQKRGRHPRIGVMHGRMKEGEMIGAMNGFRDKQIDILLATTIIENGLDISSANTLIVDDATLIGLSEAHQLRGRVGRSADQAFAYFLYRPRRLTPKAADRLEALQEYAELGAGYDLALRDLEIRGAGNILGKEQSGTINKVGLNLYYQMLSEAIEEECAVANEKATV